MSSIKFPDNYEFQKIYIQAFGIMEGNPFEVDFSGKPAAYVAERNWSPDQHILPLENGRIRLIFSASSRTELLPWVMAFTADATVIRPEWLVHEVKTAATALMSNYR